MAYGSAFNSKVVLRLLSAGWLCVLVALAAVHIGCSSSTSTMPAGSGTGTIHVSITDPPSCAFPNGSFDHVWVTVRSVQAHTSATADDNTPGWQELAPQLANNPMQIDLFGLANGCVLAQLGSNTALPVGTYQQIRLLLVPDNTSGAVPADNACKSLGLVFNCVQLHSDLSFHELLLSS